VTSITIRWCCLPVSKVPTTRCSPLVSPVTPIPTCVAPAKSASCPPPNRRPGNEHSTEPLRPAGGQGFACLVVCTDAGLAAAGLGDDFGIGRTGDAQQFATVAVDCVGECWAVIWLLPQGDRLLTCQL
jgi:hypothetical protein